MLQTGLDKVAHAHRVATQQSYKSSIRVFTGPVWATRRHKRESVRLLRANLGPKSPKNQPVFQRWKADKARRGRSDCRSGGVKVFVEGSRPPARRAFCQRRAVRHSLGVSCFSLRVVVQDEAVMEPPRRTDMNQGLRRLSRTLNQPTLSVSTLFDATEPGCSGPGARPQRFTQPHRHGEEPAQIQLYRPAARRV